MSNGSSMEGESIEESLLSAFISMIKKPGV